MRYSDEGKQKLLAQCGFHNGIDFSGCSAIVERKVFEMLAYLAHNCEPKELLRQPGQEDDNE
jgi:hypothetical protein